MYYDPEVGRFISPDDTDLVTASPTSFIDKNLYIYCDNNPITRKDKSGNDWETVLDVVSLGFSIAEVAANPYDASVWAGLAGDAVDLIPFVKRTKTIYELNPYNRRSARVGVRQLRRYNRKLGGRNRMRLEFY